MMVNDGVSRARGCCHLLSFAYRMMRNVEVRACVTAVDEYHKRELGWDICSIYHLDIKGNIDYRSNCNK